ncbi:MAG: N-acetyl-gamma-glutamyl-phosphate reductase [Thermoleophilia bacterium]|nr:N-acetyl-gamma-glutamyl-phosphate reductase [Thermoleophilia bacterium]
MSTVHVIGAAGFAGAQLAALIDAHPHFTLGQITARADAGRRLVEVAPEYRVDAVLAEFDPADVVAGDFAAVCYPHGEAAAAVSELVDRGVRVVDVSADHRLRDAAAYPAWYGFDHPRPDLVAHAVYGLPEINREAIRTATLVANPGCYPTASLLALLPLRGRLSDIIIDAKSGVSGAGRTPTPDVHYSSVADNVRAYQVLTHRHTPEIAQEMGAPVVFTPHLVPVDRGLLVSAYARIEGDVPHADDLRAAYADVYEGHPFVEVVDAPPDLRAVQHTNLAQVCPLVDPTSARLIVFAVIDNLMKGAAGQAVQNLNLMAGRPETEGLL